MAIKNVIRLLEPGLINQIAAGEVIERPASVVKELVENALDAGATHIKVFLRDGGQSLISVMDNGCGMCAADLELAVERHATSKLPDGNLSHISTLGFRGEALPSIGAIARLSLTSRPLGETEAWELKVEGGIKHPLKPAVLSGGTKIDVHDLFFATPARLKFLKSPQTELAYIQETLQRLALAHPQVAFELSEGTRKIFHYEAQPQEEGLLLRLKAVLGKDFHQNALPVAAVQQEYTLAGFAALPTFHRANTHSQYFFVNGRPVKDKLLTTLARIAYQDLLPKERSPVFVLFLTLPAEDLDINVHPAKIEVRFRDHSLVRSLILGGLKSLLHEAGHRTSSTLSQTALRAFRAPAPTLSSVLPFPRQDSQPPAFPGMANNNDPHPLKNLYLEEAPQEDFVTSPPPTPSSPLLEHPLGEALAQIHHSYIVAQTSAGLVLVDQHAAHERLVYEAMKKSLDGSGKGGEKLPRQMLLIPEVIDLPPGRLKLFQKHVDDFAQFGLVVEPFGEDALLVREIPSLLKIEDIKALLTNLADNLDMLLAEKTGQDALRDVFETLFASMACRGSIKAGKRLSREEMNALLRQMEATPHAGQCNHGRPTYVELHLTDIEKLFSRR